MKMTQELTALWEQGFRPYEIYTSNKERVYYCDRWRQAGEVQGWNIEFVFSTRELLKSYPYFDDVICVAHGACVETVWKG